VGWGNNPFGGGHPCADYESKLWCSGGTIVEAWTTGANWNYPENNCCVCGKSPPPAPPPAPLATAVVLSTFTLSGDVSDYGPAEQNTIRRAIATAASVPVSVVRIHLTAASVLVKASIAVADATVAASVSATLSGGILASPDALKSALMADGLTSVTVTTAPTTTSGTSCDGHCLDGTCADARGLPCNSLIRMGCDCGTCCDSSDANDNPPEVCGPGLTWSDVTRMCEVTCAA